MELRMEGASTLIHSSARGCQVGERLPALVKAVREGFSEEVMFKL